MRVREHALFGQWLHLLPSILSRKLLIPTLLLVHPCYAYFRRKIYIPEISVLPSIIVFSFSHDEMSYERYESEIWWTFGYIIRRPILTFFKRRNNNNSNIRHLLHPSFCLLSKYCPVNYYIMAEIKKKKKKKSRATLLEGRQSRAVHPVYSRVNSTWVNWW